MTFEVKKLKKTFGGLVAVNNVDLRVKEKTIHAIIGPNGAGKTTIYNCITGVYQADSGEILFNSENIVNLPTYEICARGIARTFQNIRLFPYMSVIENVKTGTHPISKSRLWSVLLHTPGFKREEKEVEQFALALLERVGLVDKKDFLAKNLPYGEQRKLEIARALASKPELLLLDEPAAGMNNRETAELNELIISLKDDGFTILVIEHDMKLVMSISDIISVIDYGVKIAEGTAREIQNNELVIEAYLGKRR